MLGDYYIHEFNKENNCNCGGIYSRKYSCSVAMVAMWTSGDLFKTIYFIVRDSPVQFIFCGVLQVLIDFAILMQIFVYGSGVDKSFRPLPKEKDTGL